MRKFAICIAAAVFGVALAGAGRAQDYPQQPVHFIVSFGPGGGADIIGRILADAMQRKLGTPVIVENKPGAGGIIGNDIVAKARPDGYTLGVATVSTIARSLSSSTSLRVAGTVRAGS